MFNVDHFITDCQSALKVGGDAEARATVRELTERAVAEPSAVIAALGEPQRAGLNTIYHADDLTILNIVWGPEMKLHPHDHRMWAIIGIYSGREDNTFYQRGESGLRQHGNKVLECGDVASLGKDVIHSVYNPLLKFTAAIHVYGGDFFGADRSEWDPDTLQEQPFNIEHSHALFEESNHRWEQQLQQQG